MATDPARDAAYAVIFADRAAIRHVLDDTQQFIAGLPADQQPGAWRLYGYWQLRESAPRREKRRVALKEKIKP
ncbi:MAG: hypothetical protein HYV99_01550 [Betaproteobacteria bacterium]|nr:hypothetical protein [Betaproteobacteria bacterium]